MTGSSFNLYEDPDRPGHYHTCSRKRLMAASLLTLLIVGVVAGIVAGVVVSQAQGGDDDSTSHNDRYAREDNPEFWYDVATEELKKVLETKYQMGVAKNVILFIGDGMGPTSVTAGRILAGQLKHGKGEDYHLHFDQFPHIGLSKTYNVDTQTTDSAASATAYLTGVKTRQSLLAISAMARYGNCSSGKGNEVDSILKWFHDDGRPTGVVTTTRVTHATPAASYCHSVDREWEADINVPKGQDCKDIAAQLVDEAPFINVVMGGGRRNFRKNVTSDVDNPNNGVRKDGRDLVKIWKDGKGEKKANYVENRDELLQAPDDTEYLLGLFSQSHMDFEYVRDKKVQPSLAEMTSKAIKVLQANSKGDKGFFLMVEGGRIDHGHHYGKAVLAIHEVVSFSEAVGEAVKLTNIADTLIVVTADHSHTMALAGYPNRGNPIFGKATLDKGILDEYLLDKKPYTTLLYGNGPGYKVPRENITNVNTTNKDYLQQAAVPISQETHGGEDVAIYATGPQSFLYSGVHEQNYIPMLMAYASCVGPFGEGKKACAKNSTANVPRPV